MPPWRRARTASSRSPRSSSEANSSACQSRSTAVRITSRSPKSSSSALLMYDQSFLTISRTKRRSSQSLLGTCATALWFCNAAVRAMSRSSLSSSEANSYARQFFSTAAVTTMGSRRTSGGAMRSCRPCSWTFSSHSACRRGRRSSVTSTASSASTKTFPRNSFSGSSLFPEPKKSRCSMTVMPVRVCTPSFTSMGLQLRRSATTVHRNRLSRVKTLIST
mmetsp:Transcript_15191/g.43424  ORF Transcript_15191/g.43424 Transcript_15191/m.43424 type:complete len:220 (-) Transcript_15191:82-741(-)